MWMTILSFLGGPVIKALIDAHQAKLKAANITARSPPIWLRLKSPRRPLRRRR